MRVLLFVVCIVASITGLAQPGNYFLTHHTPSDERIDYVTYSMVQDHKGIIYFANKSGVLEFDGRNWTLISTPGPVYTISTLGDEVFVAGYNGFGKLNWAKQSGWSFESLSTEIKGANQFFASQALDNSIYFLNHDAVFVHNVSNGNTEIIKPEKEQGALNGMFQILGGLYVTTDGDGLCKVENGKIVKAEFILPDNKVALFAANLQGKDRTLIGSEDGSLFLYDNLGLREISVKNKGFLETNVVVNGTWVSESLIAIATLRGGVMFIKPDTGETEEITNYYTGLPDNEVYTLLSDRNQGVWVANDYGFTRIAPYLPFRSYNHYQGLEGNMLCVATHREQIYVGTTLGLYKLHREEVYETPEPVTGNKTINRQVQNQPSQPTPGAGKKGLFAFLRKQKSIAKQEENGQVVIAKKPVYTKPPAPVLKAIQYSFKKVSGVEGKVSQLEEAGDRLLVAGNVGVVEVDGLQSRSITSHPVRSIFISPSLNGQLIVSTQDEQIKTFAKESKGWVETHLLDTIQDYVSYVFEDKIQNVWMCSRTSVYKVETIDNEIVSVESIPFPNPAIDETTGLAYGSEVYVAASGMFNRFNIGKNIFEKFDSLPGPKKYFASAGYFWFHDGHRWRTVDARMQAALKLEWLSLFQNIRFIAPAGKGEGLWVITGENELYKFSSNKVATEQVSYPLFLREVRSQQSKIAPARTVVVSQLESTVTFEFIQPDFLGMKAVEYRYLIKGLSKGWSTWSTDNNIVNFSYLPVGEYQVEVQTRDLMGKISNVEQIELQVEPPYWKRSWFYAAEFFFFTILVVISMRMNQSNSRNRLISRLLTLLTVIMLIQFIQTVVSSQISLESTPVIDFFVQVSIALLVLPLEVFLRKRILRAGAVVAVKEPVNP